tara:strand:+ start:9751 stop:13023 length:3273 start_codon:yes stop_codon:yes gene_type:complete
LNSSFTGNALWFQEDSPSAPQNENALCVYNLNTNISKDICEYYVSKRPGVNILGLDVPLDKFTDTVSPLLSSNGIDEFIPEGELVGPADGVVGNAYSFNGFSDYVGDEQRDLRENVSFSFWLNKSSSQYGGYIEGIILTTDGADMGVLGIGYTDEERFFWRFKYPDQIYVNNYWVLDGEFHHYVIVKEDKDVYLYRDNEYIGTESFDENWNVSFKSIGMGYCNGCSPGATSYTYFNETIDEFRAYNRSLDAAEIETLYGLGEVEDQLVVYYPLEEVYLNSTGSYEDMENEEFETYVKQPVWDYVDDNPGLDITHIALAKDIPTTVDTRSGSGYLTSGSVAGNEFMGKIEHFDPDNYDDIRFAVSYLTGYNLEDIKTMINKSVGPVGNDLKWVVDRDSDEWSIAENVLNDSGTWLMASGISADNIILEDSDSIPISTDGEVVAYVGPGNYHVNYGGGNWIYETDNFDFDVSNRSFMSSHESFNGVSFKENPYYVENSYQGKIAQAFSENAFGGSNYSRSFAGAMGYVAEPGANDDRLSRFVIAYANGMTFAESAMSGWTNLWSNSKYSGRGIAVGDPLMRLYDADKVGLRMNCSDDSDCFTGSCNIDLDGTKRCSSEKSVCINSDEIVYSVGSWISRLENFETASEASVCFNDSHSAYCDNGIWNELESCGEGFCSSVSGECRQSTVGSECSSDSDCEIDGNPFFCGIDYFGLERCRSDATGCVVSSLGEEVPNGDYYCVNETHRSQCIDLNWSEVLEECDNYCNDGLCMPNTIVNYTFNITEGVWFSFSLPIKPLSPLINRIFSNATYGDSFMLGNKIYINENGSLNGYYQMGEWGAPYEYWSGKWAESYWDDSITNASIAVGQGFMIEGADSLNYSLTISGSEINEPSTVNIIGETNYIGVPYCYEEYDAERLFDEVNELDGNCSELYGYNDSIGDYSMWNGTGVNFEIENYRAYIIYCNESTNITWTPSCEDSSQAGGGDSGGDESGGGSGSGGSGSGNDEESDAGDEPNETISINQTSDSFTDDLGLTLDGKGEYQWLLWASGGLLLVIFVLSSFAFLIPNYLKRKRLGNVLSRTNTTENTRNSEIL